MFDMNSFDDDFEEEEEEELPPPPTFSEEELADARQKAFDEGKQAGLDEAAASRDREVVNLVAALSQNFALLFAAEEEREARYENEAAHLARAIFQTLFPRLNETQALDEIDHFVRQALSIHSGSDTPEIIVEVHPDDLNELDARLSALKDDNSFSGLYTMRAAPNLARGDCRLLWYNGGGKRDISGLKEQIEEYFEQSLAGKPRLGDNEEDNADNNADNDSTEPDVPDTSPPEETPALSIDDDHAADGEKE